MKYFKFWDGFTLLATDDWSLVNEVSIMIVLLELDENDGA